MNALKNIGPRRTGTRHAKGGNDERFTTEEVDLTCRRLADVAHWDVDVAACSEHHLAERYYTKVNSGLAESALWAGSVWCNPPFSKPRPWLERAWAEHQIAMECGNNPHLVIAMLLPGTRTEQPWWQELVEPYRDQPASFLRSYFLQGRTNFAHPGSKGIAKRGSPFGCVLLVWRLHAGLSQAGLQSVGAPVAPRRPWRTNPLFLPV